MLFFFFKQKTAYEMRISDWSSDVCSSDLAPSISTLPADGFSRPAAALSSVDLPQPVGPTMATNSPGATARSMPATARWLKDRKSVVEGKSVSVSVDLGGRRLIKKNKANKHNEEKKNRHNLQTVQIP